MDSSVFVLSGGLDVENSRRTGSGLKKCILGAISISFLSFVEIDLPNKKSDTGANRVDGLLIPLKTEMTLPLRNLFMSNILFMLGKRRIKNYYLYIDTFYTLN